MVRNPMSWCLPIALATAVAAATAQTAVPRTPKTDPLNAQAAVPALRHDPAFAGYRRLVEIEPVEWLQANDTVRRIGGWRSYARDANGAAAAPPPAAKPAP